MRDVKPSFAAVHEERGMAIESSRSGLDDAPFSYRDRGNGKVYISWRGHHVKILKGDRALSFLRGVSGLDLRGQQLVVAKITGHFKRGNEHGK